MECEIYFSDLNEKGKKKVLEYYDAESEKELNLDTFPLAFIVAEAVLSDEDTDSFLRKLAEKDRGS